MNLSKFSNVLEYKEGIYYSVNNNKLSYPEDGNQNCFQIEQNSFWFNHRNNCIINSVKKYCNNSVFFDIGGGNGFVTKGLTENGLSSVLLEPGIEGCKNAQMRGVENIICATLEDAKINNNSLPAVGLFDVVEHIEEDSIFLNQIYKLIEPGGFIFITVPAFKFLWSNDDSYAGHFRRYTISDLEIKLKNSGFKIQYSTYIFSILIFAVFLFRTLPSRLGFNKNPGDLNKNQNEHKRKNGIIDRFLSLIWRYELNQIKKGKKILFGGSCFIVAKK